MMPQVQRWVTLAAKVAEVLGSICAAALAILADGNLHSTDGHNAVMFALVAGVGHTVTHHANPKVQP